MYKASIILFDAKKANDYARVIDSKIGYKHSKVSAKVGPKGLMITVDADDQVSLFATMNSVLKQLRIIGNIDKRIDEL